MPEIELISDLNVGDADGVTPDGITLVYKTTYTEFSDDGGSWPVLQVIWTSGVGPSLVAAFIYDIIKKVAEKRSNKHPKRIQIDRVWIDFEAGQIQRRIEESVKIEE